MSRTSRIRGVVFDYGGVIARSPVLTDFQPIAEEIGLTWDIYRDGFSRYRLAYDSDLISCREMYRRIADEHGLTMSDEQCRLLCQADDRSWLHPDEDVRMWMKELHDKGFRLGILTNMASGFFNNRVKNVFSEHIGLADALVVSGIEGVSKPDPRIYSLLERRIGLKSDEFVFFDDNMTNVLGARKMRWRAFQFASVEGARRDLAEVLGEVE